MSNPNYSPVQSTPPVWQGDYSGREHVMPFGARLDSAQFPAEDAVVVTVGAGGAAQGVTNVPVAALSGPIPSGTMIDMGGAKLVVLSAQAAAGAVSLTVRALVTALVAGDKGTYMGVGKKRVPSGTLIGRTYAERDAGAPWGPADVNTPDDEIYLTHREASDLAKSDKTEVYRHYGVVKENYLPNWASLSTAVKAKIRSLYKCESGVN